MSYFHILIHRNRVGFSFADTIFPEFFARSGAAHAACPLPPNWRWIIPFRLIEYMRPLVQGTFWNRLDRAMFDKLLREMKKLERGVQVPIQIHLDDDGQLDRRCPSEECQAEFQGAPRRLGAQSSRRSPVTARLAGMGLWLRSGIRPCNAKVCAKPVYAPLRQSVIRSAFAGGQPPVLCPATEGRAHPTIPIVSSDPAGDLNTAERRELSQPTFHV